MATSSPIMVKHARTVSSMMEHGDFTHAFSNRLGTICCAPLLPALASCCSEFYDRTDYFKDEEA